MKLVAAVFQLRKRGGKERDCLAVARYLAARGHDVTVVTTSGTSDMPPGVRVTVLPATGASNHVRARNFATAVAEHAAATRPDALIAFERIPGADVYFAADAAVALRLSGVLSFLPRRRTYLALERGVAGPAAQTRIFFLTQRQRDEYTAIYGLDAARGIVLPPILHDERYDAALHPTAREQVRARLGLPTDAVVAIAIAVQPKQKGIDRTLAALAQRKDIHLLAVGSPDAAIAARARQLNIADRVRVIPYADNVMELMAAADMLLHPARAEAAGQVIVEALLAGTPAIVSAICGYADAVTRSGAGIVLPEPFRQDDFTAAIVKMTANLPAMREAAAAESLRQRPLRGRWLSVISDAVEAAARDRASRTATAGA